MRGNFFYKRLGQRVAKARQIKKITQEGLSQMADIDRTYLARIESGKANPSIRILHTIAIILHVRMCELLEGV